MRLPIRVLKSLLSQLIFSDRILVTWPIEIDFFFRAHDRMIPSQAALPYRRKLLMAITVWHVLFLQKDTFRARSIAFRRDRIAIRSPRADEEQRCQ